jgi:hypothetical protein
MTYRLKIERNARHLDKSIPASLMKLVQKADLVRAGNVHPKHQLSLIKRQNL